MERFDGMVEEFCDKNKEFDAEQARAEFERIVKRIVYGSWFV